MILHMSVEGMCPLSPSKKSLLKALNNGSLVCLTEPAVEKTETLDRNIILTYPHL